MKIQYIESKVYGFNENGKYAFHFNRLMRQLYPDHKGNFDFPEFDDGYRLVFLESGDDEVIALCGFYLLNHVSKGKTIHVTDLVVDEQKRRLKLGGYILNDIQENFMPKTMHIESSLYLESAHRFYMKEGYSIGKFIFEKTGN